MADIITTINGEPTTLIDNGDGTYRIDLGTQDARRFVRGELDQLRAEKATLVEKRDSLEQARLEAIAIRDIMVTDKAAVVAEIDSINANINELVAWLQGQGDPT